MTKTPYTAEEKIKIAKQYLWGKGSYSQLAQEYGIGKRTLREWVYKYQEQGEAGFQKGNGNKHYSKGFKLMCVEAVLRGEGTADEIVAKYNISCRSVLRCWIMRLDVPAVGNNQGSLLQVASQRGSKSGT